MIVPITLAACSSSQNPQGIDVVKQDVGSIYADQIPNKITLEDAVTLALENNLDAKIAEQDFIKV